MFIMYLPELNVTANEIVIVTSLRELIVPERHTHVSRQLHSAADLLHIGGRTGFYRCSEEIKIFKFLRMLKR